MAPKVEFAFTLRLYLHDEVSLGPVKSGPSRLIAPISHGFINGSGVHAIVLPGGGDWGLIDHDKGYEHLSIRAHARSDDGYIFSISYKGVVKLDEAVQEFARWNGKAKTTSFGDHQWFITPLIETNHPNYKFWEETVFVGQGRCIVESQGAQAVEYEVHQVSN